MQVDIQSRDLTLTNGLRDYLTTRLAYGLTAGDAAIGRVIVLLSGVNGPRGGEDKRCHIEVRLRGIPDVVIEDIQTDLYVAIDRATERAGRALVRRLGQRRAFAPPARGGEGVPESDGLTPERT
jgi:putative sigma-54 modulation protein